MSEIQTILSISTHLDHIVHPLTCEKGIDKPSLVKRITGIAVFIFISALTFGLTSIYYIYKAKWKQNKIVQLQQQPINSNPPQIPISPLLDFDKPVYLSTHQILHTLKINTKYMLSDIPEYHDSTFSVAQIPNELGLYEVIRHKIMTGLSSKRELTASQLTTNSETLKKIAKVAKNWRNIALEKTTDGGELFSDAADLSNAIAYCMKNSSEAWRWDRIFICQDVALREIQAIALARSFPDKLKLTHLVTHPNNIRSWLNRVETNRVEGAGSTLVNYIASTLPISCQEIYLESVESAKMFYQKLGFEKLDPNQHRPVDDPGLIPMSLSAQKIQRI